MAGRLSIGRAVMSAEIAAIRRQDPDLEPGDIAGFTAIRRFFEDDASADQP